MAVRNPRGYGPQRYVNDNATSTVMEDGVEISDVINTFNFAGDGVSTSVVDDVVTVTVPGTFTVQEEGVTTSTAVRTLNFVGAGTASGGAATATITIPAATLTTQEEGSTLSSTVTTINFVGQDLVASGAGATTTVTKGGLATTVTSATPVVLTAASARIQVFTGSTAQTVTLPVVATAPASNGYNWEFHNNSTATMTIQTSGPNTLATLYTGQWGVATIVDTAGGTGTASWDFVYGTSGNPVLDSAASPPYPIAGDTKGVWFGTNTKANAFDSSCVTIGASADTGTASSTAVGANASATGESTSAFGAGAAASGQGGTALGLLSSATQRGGTGLGWLGQATGFESTAVGFLTVASGQSSVAIGHPQLGGSTTASGLASIAILGTANSSSSIAIGEFANSNSIVGAIVLSATSTVPTAVANDAAHAFSISVNSANVNPGTLGLTLRNESVQIPVYGSYYASTATAAGTTTLTVTSAKMQRFSGATTQTCVLPVVTTLANGFEFVIVNDSTGAVTVQSSGANTVTTLAAASVGVNRGGWGRFVCVDTAGGTGVASWTYLPGATIL
jgi:hypothetical protein